MGDGRDLGGTGWTLTRGATPGIHMARAWPCFSTRAVVWKVCWERVLARAPTLLTRLGLALGVFWAPWRPGVRPGWESGEGARSRESWLHLGLDSSCHHPTASSW